MMKGIFPAMIRLKYFKPGIMVLTAVTIVACTGSTRGRYPGADKWNEYARFIAGMKLTEGSSLGLYTNSSRYQKYNEHIDIIWERFKKQKLEKIEDWRSVQMKDINGKTIFYPFSGPDILNALAFFPEAREFIMVGLEEPGEVPALGSMKPSTIYAGLWKLNRSLRTILNLNLFRTREMQADLEDYSFSSITGVMLFFLARYGCDILDVRYFCIDRKGAVGYEYCSGRLRGTCGVEVVFRLDKRVRKARYFSVDLSDPSLEDKRFLVKNLKRYRGVTTLIKSASYLLSYPSFTRLRTLLLANSAVIVQGDSGIPYRYFSPDIWDIDLYGNYRVLPMFNHRFQRDLHAAMVKHSRGMLPFSYGYGFIPENSHLMIMRKK